MVSPPTQCGSSSCVNRKTAFIRDSLRPASAHAARAAFFLCQEDSAQGRTLLQILECGGRAQRRHRFRTSEALPNITTLSTAQTRRRRCALPAHSKGAPNPGQAVEHATLCSSTATNGRNTKDQKPNTNPERFRGRETPTILNHQYAISVVEFWILELLWCLVFGVFNPLTAAAPPELRHLCSPPAIEGRTGAPSH
jgi:hypothetical protein